MLLLSILFYLFIVIGLVHIIHFALYLIGANLYDIQTYRSNLRRKRSGKDYRPLVSVLVPAYNEERVVNRCLQSIWNNTYGNIEIIVVSDGSSDSTVQSVQRFINSRSKAYGKVEPKIVRSKNGLRRVWQRGQVPVSRRIKLVQQLNGGKASALNRALRYHARGELIMTLDADSILHKRAVANVIKYFEDPKIAGVAANVRIIEKNSILGVLQRFEHLISYRSKKFYTAVGCELIIGGVASTYRRKAMDKVRYYDTNTVTEDIGLSMKIAARGNRKNRLVYAVDVVAMTEGVNDFSELLRQRYRWKLGMLQNLFKYNHILFSKDSKYSKSLSWYRMPMSFIGEALLLLEPISLGYILYLSIHFLTPALFMAAYITITLYMLFVVWPDEHLSTSGKLKASVYIPALYFIFYIMNFVQLVSILRCIKNRKTVTTLTNSRASSWISPKRVGGTVAIS